MASRVENSVDIDRPIAEVFAFVDDYRNTTRYIVGMTEYRPTTDRTSGDGARFAMVKKTTGLPDIKSEVEIHGWSENSRIAFRSISGFENSGSYTFTERGGKTNVKLVNDYDLTSLLGGGGGLFGGLKKAAGGALSKAAEGQARKDLTGSLDKLRELVEAAPRKPLPAPKAAAKAAPRKAAPARTGAAKPTSAKPASSKPAVAKTATARPATAKTASAKPAAARTSSPTAKAPAEKKPAAKKPAAKATTRSKPAAK
ncbi:MAG: hypothetical protein NVSMB17_13200 [Candidatus Dormibacteria bacterium]